MSELTASKALGTVVRLNLPTWAVQRVITVSSFTFHLTVSC